MAEYIEREAISEEIRKYYYKNPPNFSYGEGFDRGLDRAQRAILDAPAADVAEVVHGRWDDSGRYTFPNGTTAVRCTICGCALNESEYHLYDWNYCPICGAKMDGGDSNSDICSKTI